MRAARRERMVVGGELEGKCCLSDARRFVPGFSVWNTIMGSSLLTMAWGVERAGLSVALVLMALMAALCLYTAYVLLRVNVHHAAADGAACEVPALCRALLGRGAQRVAHGFSLLVPARGQRSLLASHDQLSLFHCQLFHRPDVAGLTRLTLLGAALHRTHLRPALIIFPLLSFRNVSFFTKFNSLGTLSVLYLVFLRVREDVDVGGWRVRQQGGRPPGRWRGRGGSHAAALSGMLALSFYIHNIIITIMSNNAKQENNGRDLTIAFILVTVTYLIVGVGFYIGFPLAKACIEDNILNNFDMHDVMTALARMLLLFSGLLVVTVYPLVAFMLRTEAILLLPIKDSRASMFTINVIIVTMCILMACFCPSIGTII
ncbi:hypothetical protein ACJJTC_018425, partial [Scirpophaga incertulas]